MPIIRNKIQKLVKPGQTEIGLDRRRKDSLTVGQIYAIYNRFVFLSRSKPVSSNENSRYPLRQFFEAPALLNNFLGSKKTGRGLGRYVAQLECVKCISGPEHFLVPISADCEESLMGKIVIVQPMGLLSAGRTHLAHRLPMTAPLFLGHGWMEFFKSLNLL